MTKNEFLQCAVFGAVALVAGCLCHHLSPGLGLVLMPMFWPLAVLSTRVSLGKSAATAAIVPFVSFLLTGMPAMPLVVAVKFAVFAAAVSVAWRLLRRLRNR